MRRCSLPPILPSWAARPERNSARWDDLVVQDRVDLYVVMPSAVVPGAACRALVPESALDCEPPGSSIVRMNHQTDAIDPLGLEQVADYEVDRLGGDALAALVRLVDLV